MANDPTLYVCKNPRCELGTLGQLGRFTSGLTAEARSLKTGEPVETLIEGKDYGEGFCPHTSCMERKPDGSWIVSKGEKFDPRKALAAALAEAEADHKARVKALRAEGVA